MKVECYQCHLSLGQCYDISLSKMNNDVNKCARKRMAYSCCLCYCVISNRKLALNRITDRGIPGHTEDLECKQFFQNLARNLVGLEFFYHMEAAPISTRAESQVLHPYITESLKKIYTCNGFLSDASMHKNFR